MKAEQYLESKDIGNWILDSHARWKYEEKLSYVMDHYAKVQMNIFINDLLHEAQLRGIDVLVQSCINSIKEND